MSLAAGDLLAEASVRLTDRTGRAKQFRLNAKGLILGSAPGCDLRLEQSAPPVWVLLAACPGGVLIRSLAPLARIEVNGQRWQAGIASFPALVTLGDIKLEINGQGIEAAPMPPTKLDHVEAEPEHAADRWYRKARHLLKLMRGLVTGGSGAEPSGQAQAEQASPSVSPALETAWQMLRVAQEQHRDDLVRLERERALVASRWAEIERERAERESEILRQRQTHAELESLEQALVAREASVAQSEQELLQRQLELQIEIQKSREEKESLSRAVYDLEERKSILASRELEVEGKLLVGKTAVAEPGVVGQPGPAPLSPPEQGPARQTVLENKAQAITPMVPVIPEAWFGPSVAEPQTQATINSTTIGVPASNSDPSHAGERLSSQVILPDAAQGSDSPEWISGWFRKRFAHAAQTRGSQAAGPAIWDATGQIADVDSKLARTLQDWGFAAPANLETLLAVARQERRPLRSLLLGDGVVTMHQLAQIESGNLAGLYAGPLVILERLPSGPREVTHAVHDPQRGAEGILQQLAETEMADAARPDEFVQRAQAVASIESENLQGIWNVFEIDGRPAVLREGVVGSGSDGWSTLAAVPGVWYRLLLQAALGLRDLHLAGLCHGRVEASHVVATPTGLIKLMNPAVPQWLSGLDLEESPQADLKSLARLARHWLSDENRPGPKPKPLPEILSNILDRLEGIATPPITTAVELADELDRAGSQVPGNSAALQRFLAEIRADIGMEQSAIPA